MIKAKIKLNKINFKSLTGSHVCSCDTVTKYTYEVITNVKCVIQCETDIH